MNLNRELYFELKESTLHHTRQGVRLTLNYGFLDLADVLSAHSISFPT